jgi:hypothetical protein
MKKNVCSLDKRVIQIQRGERETKKDKITANLFPTILEKTKYVIKIPIIDTESANQNKI